MQDLARSADALLADLGPGDSQRESGRFAQINSQSNPYFHDVSNDSRIASKLRFALLMPRNVTVGTLAQAPCPLKRGQCFLFGDFGLCAFHWVKSALSTNVSETVSLMQSYCARSVILPRAAGVSCVPAGVFRSNATSEHRGLISHSFFPPPDPTTRMQKPTTAVAQVTDWRGAIDCRDKRNGTLVRNLLECGVLVAQHRDPYRATGYSHTQPAYVFRYCSLCGKFLRSASLAIPHRNFAAMPSVSLVHLGHTNHNVSLSHESQRELAFV